jgi:hypothetical protein
MRAQEAEAEEAQTSQRQKGRQQVKARIEIALTSLVLACLLAAIAAAPAAAAPTFDTQLTLAAGHPVPVTHSDEHLAYEVKVTNNASVTPQMGDGLRCLGTPAEKHHWFGKNPAPSFTYQWLRNGSPIVPSEEGPWPAAPAIPTHTIVPADEGQSIQCKVTGTNDLDGAGSTYEPVSSSSVSPPLWVEPVPVPTPPSGLGAPVKLGPIEASAPYVATATTTAGSNKLANVVTTKATGTLAKGSNVVTGLSVSLGEFRKGQAVIGPGIPGEATGTGVVDDFGSKLLTGVNTTTGAFEVGQEVRADAVGLGGGGVVITAVGAGTLEISHNIFASAGTKLDLYAFTSVISVGPGDAITLSAPAGLSGAQELSAGALPLSDQQIISSPAFPNTVGTGNLIDGDKLVTGVSTSSGAFAVGQAISGLGIQPGTTVSEVGAGTITLSTGATASSSAAPLTGRPRVIGFTVGRKAELSDKASASASGVEMTATSEFACRPPQNWKGTGMVWSYQWLRNGQPLPGENDPVYVAKKADIGLPTLFQCEARVVDGAGNEAVSISTVVQVQPRAPSPYEAPSQVEPEFPTLASNNTTTGKVTIEASLPPGTEALAAAGLAAGDGGGWSCSKTPLTASEVSSVRCDNENPLPPGGKSLAPVLIEAQVQRGAPDSLVAKACASGGGSVGSACSEDTLSGLLPEVPFGFKSFVTSVLDEEGNEFLQAGGHPHEAGAHLAFTEHTKAQHTAEAQYRGANGFAREIRTEVPPGFAGNVEALGELCASTEEVVALPTGCPLASVVGGISFKVAVGEYAMQPIYAIEPERGTPAQFAFGVGALKPGFAFTLTPELRPADDYGITLVASPGPKTPELFEATVTLCGRGAKIESQAGEAKFERCWKSTDPQALERPFLTLPTKCNDEESSTTRILADTWEERGKYAEAKYTLPAPEGCNALAFEPTLKARPTTNQADSPTGLEVDLQIPANEDPEGTATAQLKKAVVTLPEGMTVNPSSANGLGACTSAQIKLGTNEPISCPDASKLGSVQAETPILGHPLPGALYLAAPHDNPFGSLLALYLVIDSPDDGLLIKLAGKVEADPDTGRLTTTFEDNPQAPVSRVQLKLRSGAAAPLRTPEKCAKYATTSSFTPWSAPDSGPPATPKDNWTISRGPGGKACISSPPNEPSFEAGSASPIAAAYSPFTVKLRREDGSQTFSALNLTPPPGLLAKLAGVPYCPESAIAAASSKSGRDEQASPSCPSASRVGTVAAAAGAGPTPYNAPGTAYLAGPYKGAPLSLAVLTPAVAGPFDLGNVVVRVALRVDPETAKVSAVSDPLPQILEGIPLDVRSIAVSLDRPEFTLNPTSCNEMAVSGELISSSGATAPLQSRFQVGECTRLGFKPALKIALKGKTHRGGHPALTATLNYPKGAYANIASASVALPHSAFLEQAHIRTICTRVQFAADQCPKGAIYGKATAITPLLDEPLSGPVYLRSSSNPLPDLVVDLRGQIHVALVGKIDSVNGGIRTTFAQVPDAPVSKFTLRMQGAKKGLLVNSRDVCKTTNRATAVFTAHNGAVREARPQLKATGCGGKARKGKRDQRPRR